MPAPSLDYGRIVEKIGQLPTLPAVLDEVNRLIRDPDTGAIEVEAVLREDPSLTMSVLRMANSAFYATQQNATNLHDAIATLGFDHLQRTLVSSTVLAAFGNRSASFFNLRKFWQHSIGVAVAACSLGRLLKVSNIDDLYTCGLLHDIGKVAHFVLDPAGMKSAVKHAKRHKVELHHAEQQLGLPEHTHLGYHVCERWKLPEGIGQVVHNHHEHEPLRRTTTDFECNYATDIVMVADSILREIKFGNSGTPVKSRPPESLFTRLHISPSNYEELAHSIEAELEASHGLLSLLQG